MRHRIFSVPLELGGLIKINPSLNVTSMSFSPYLKNYSSFGPAESGNFLLASEPDEDSVISLDPDDEMRSLVPSLGRSGLLLLGRSPLASRLIRETLMSLDRSTFGYCLSSGGTVTIIDTLMSCMSREESEKDTSTPWVRLAYSQPPRDTRVFRVNSKLYEGLFGLMGIDVKTRGNKVSRTELHDLCKSFLDFDFSSDENSLTIANGESRFSLRKTNKMDVTTILDEQLTSMRELSELTPVSVNSYPALTRHETIPRTFSQMEYTDLVLRGFDSRYLPTELGGRSLVHPIHYFESRMLVKSKTIKLSQRSQTFRWCLTEKESRLPLHVKVSVANFCESGKLLFTRQSTANTVRSSKFTDAEINRMLTECSDAKIYWRFPPTDLLIPREKEGPILLTNFIAESLKEESRFKSRLDYEKIVRTIHGLGRNQRLTSPGYSGNPSDRVESPFRFSMAECVRPREEVRFSVGTNSARYLIIENQPGRLVTELLCKLRVDKRTSWFHFRTYWNCKADPPPKDPGGRDVYIYASLSGTLNVTTKSIDSVICLCVNESFPLFPLCSDLDLPTTEVFLVCRVFPLTDVDWVSTGESLTPPTSLLSTIDPPPAALSVLEEDMADADDELFDFMLSEFEKHAPAGLEMKLEIDEDTSDDELSILTTATTGSVRSIMGSFAANSLSKTQRSDMPEVSSRLRLSGVPVGKQDDVWSLRLPGRYPLGFREVLSDSGDIISPMCQLLAYIDSNPNTFEAESARTMVIEAIRSNMPLKGYLLSR